MGSRTCTYSTTTTSSTDSSTSSSTSSTTTTNTTSSTSLSGASRFDVSPPFQFLNFNGGEVISGVVKVQGSVDAASAVEMYLIPTESNVSRYIGMAKRTAVNMWEYTLDSTKQPNGSFFIATRIKNVSGSYEGGKRMIVILNRPVDEVAAISDTTGSTDSSAVSSEAEASMKNGRTSTEWQEKYFKSSECIDVRVCGGDVDPDRDGLFNNEEYRYGTNPTDPDTDHDGFLDGDEIKNGFNPLKASPGDKSDKIVFESPKEKGEVKDETYQVSNVEVIKTESGDNGLKITGKGIPNSFVTIYIYSDPIVLTVKTDDEGNWSYELDKGLDDGEHQVYVAVTDNTGKITSKSSPLAFIKTAEAVSIIPPAEAMASQRAASLTNKWTQSDWIFLVLIIMGGLTLALASIGLYRRSMLKREAGTLDENQ